MREVFKKRSYENEKQYKHVKTYLKKLIKALRNSIIKTQHRNMKFSIKGFFSKCDQIRRKLRTWSHLLKKFLMENFIFCVMR